MHSLYQYAKITFVNDPLFPDVYFVSFNNCVFIVSSGAIVLGHNICVCHLLCYLIKRYHQLFLFPFIACQLGEMLNEVTRSRSWPKFWFRDNYGMVSRP